MLPIVSYIAGLYFISISRQSFGFLAIVFVLLVHPIVSLPIGVVANAYHQKLMKLKRCPTIGLRLLTFSMNCYLALIMLIMFYLYNMWIYIRHTSDMIWDLDYTNQPFDQCACQNYGHCSAETSDFQNILSSIEIRLYFYLLLLNPMLCHIIHSLFLFLPAPIPLLDFILCIKTRTTDHQGSHETIQLQDLTETTNESNLRQHPKPKNRQSNCIFIPCILLTFVYFQILLGSPIGFQYLVKDQGNLKSGISSCPTKGLKSCHFPFTFKKRPYFGCISHSRSDLPFGSVWCPIANYTDNSGYLKTVGICEANCPGGKYCLPLNMI